MARCVIIKKLRDKAYVDKDEITGEVGLERQLIGEKTTNEVAGIA